MYRTQIIMTTLYVLRLIRSIYYILCYVVKQHNLMCPINFHGICLKATSAWYAGFDANIKDCHDCQCIIGYHYQYSRLMISSLPINVLPRHNLRFLERDECKIKSCLFVWENLKLHILTAKGLQRVAIWAGLLAKYLLFGACLYIHTVSSNHPYEVVIYRARVVFALKISMEHLKITF